jgi:hypothetical protein
VQIHNTGSQRGIYTITLDGTSIGSTIDGYAGSGSDNVISTVTGITVATPGKKRLLVKMATRNPSNTTSYLGHLNAITLQRTA